MAVAGYAVLLALAFINMSNVFLLFVLKHSFKSPKQLFRTDRLDIGAEEAAILSVAGKENEDWKVELPQM